MYNNLPDKDRKNNGETMDIETDPTKDNLSVGAVIAIIIFSGLALWIAHNVYCAYEGEIKYFCYETISEIEAFFRVIFYGTK